MPAMLIHDGTVRIRCTSAIASTRTLVSAIGKKYFQRSVLLPLYTTHDADSLCSLSTRIATGPHNPLSSTALNHRRRSSPRTASAVNRSLAPLRTLTRPSSPTPLHQCAIPHQTRSMSTTRPRNTTPTTTRIRRPRPAWPPKQDCARRLVRGLGRPSHVCR